MFDMCLVHKWGQQKEVLKLLLFINQDLFAFGQLTIFETNIINTVGINPMPALSPILFSNQNWI